METPLDELRLAVVEREREIDLALASLLERRSSRDAQVEEAELDEELEPSLGHEQALGLKRARVGAALGERVRGRVEPAEGEPDLVLEELGRYG